MPNNIKLISSRRAYEFRPDDLRLTLLSIVPLIERIREEFKFQAANVRSPIPSFGPVAQTLPPGIIFNVGSFISEETGIIPIRFLHFEQRRVVIDVAGPSSSIDAIFAYLVTMLAELRAADGSPALGKPSHNLDSSELSVQLGFSPVDVLTPGLDIVIADAIGMKNKAQAIVPTLTFQLQNENVEYGGTSVVTQTNGPMVQLALRQGTFLNEQVYFSTAPLASEDHIAYLERLEQLLSPDPLSQQIESPKQNQRRPNVRGRAKDRE